MKPIQIEKQAYRVSDFCESFSIGKTAVYVEIAKGRLKVTKVGRMTLIAKQDALNWLEKYRSEANQAVHLVAGAAS